MDADVMVDDVMSEKIFFVIVRAGTGLDLLDTKA